MMVSGIVIGVLIAFPISGFLVKRHKKKIIKQAAKKILSQKEKSFKTSDGKPIPLNFRNDGKEIDLKKQVNDEVVKTKIKEIKEYRKEVKDIEKAKKKKQTKRRKKK